MLKRSNDRKYQGRPVGNAARTGRWAFVEVTDPWDAKNTIRTVVQTGKE